MAAETQTYRVRPTEGLMAGRQTLRLTLHQGPDPAVFKADRKAVEMELTADHVTGLRAYGYEVEPAKKAAPKRAAEDKE